MTWDHPPHNPDVLVLDVPNMGRYLIKRRAKGAREFVLMLNGTLTGYYGDIESLKAITAKLIRPFANQDEQ